MISETDKPPDVCESTELSSLNSSPESGSVPLKPLNTEYADTRRLHTVLLILAFWEFVLLVYSRRLWLGDSQFPAVPFAGGALLNGATSLWARRISATGLSVMLAALVLQSVRTLFFAKTNNRTGPSSVLGRITLLTAVIPVIANQHCLQAWHWLFLICLAQIVLLPQLQVLKTLRITICMVYVCSALSRISPQIGSSMTAQIVNKLLQLSGLHMAADDSSVIVSLCWVLMAGELLVGLLLLTPYLRKVAVGLSFSLHVLLILALGPTGLNHHAGVLFWNLCFICLVPAVFLRQLSQSNGSISASLLNGRRLNLSHTPNSSVIHSKGHWRTILARGFVILFPISGLFGIADNWPSWQLYSGRPESLRLFIDGRSLKEIPHSLRAHVGAPLPLDEWCPVRLDRWSLAETDTPVYPEERFQIAVMEAILKNVTDEQSIRVDVDAPLAFPWWQRSLHSFFGRSGFREIRRNLILNSVAAESSVADADVAAENK